jgi:hypothetical protein
VERLLEHLVPIILYTQKGLSTSTEKSCIFSAFPHSFPGFQVVGGSDGTFLKCSTCVLGGLESIGVVSTLLV